MRKNCIDWMPSPAPGFETVSALQTQVCRELESREEQSESWRSLYFFDTDD